MSQHLQSHHSLENPSECPGCGFFDTGKFCSNCGSIIQNYKINLHYILNNIFEWEDKVTYTTLQLIKQPIPFLKAYMDGNRLRTYIPFKYLFFCFGLFCFVHEMFSLHDLYTDPVDVYISQINVYKNDVVFDNIINNFGKFFVLLFIPFYIISTKIFFPKSTYNLAERATAVTYMLGMLMMIQVVLGLVTALIHPFYFIKPFIVFGIQFYIIFILSFRFFGATLFEAVWKSVFSFVCIMMLFKSTMFGLDVLISFFY
ncbi:MAG: hypothetical protein IPN79_15980 [Saprospiraceae bacterium]|nr:hypothetical protein [Saprospiraceae bacterium]